MRLRWRVRRNPADAAESLNDLANAVTHDSAARPDRVESVLLPGGPPTGDAERAQLFELYKIMVQTSEALVARRQGTNTFFLTANGVLLTALGFVLRAGADPRSHSSVVAVLCLTGCIISWAWRSLLVSFGQLNKGKFAVILRLEKHFAASIFEAEWAALGRGTDPKVYRSFTESETRVPFVFMAIYVVAALVALFIVAGWQP
ncbi:hypothetical protein [Actinoplanes sp. N902-109]|uniref:RipA family octameric membrane protein n=1 Tax=Actinoplanes sp. (strain N902-109) TaxID=649831 RepID=UPI00032938FD|nr:hypothetical protein [Actinoplanes sp. N902-109]AGL21544.1 hypothetical protein L083_8034 [Actinoplanes sp. N902-109]